MKWQEIRTHYPQQWLLVEAIQARSQANKRILEQLAVVGTFPDSVTAIQNYTQLHRKAPERELYVFHTSRETLDVTERRWLGIRGARYNDKPQRLCWRREILKVVTPKEFLQEIGELK